MNEEPALDEHDLALGGTRPALMPYLAIPWRDFVIFLIVAVECVNTRWQFLIPLGVVFSYSMVLYRKDYNAGRCFVCWLQTSGRHLAAHVLGGTFVSPQITHEERPVFRGMIRG